MLPWYFPSLNLPLTYYFQYFWYYFHLKTCYLFEPSNYLCLPIYFLFEVITLCSLMGGRNPAQAPTKSLLSSTMVAQQRIRDLRPPRSWGIWRMRVTEPLHRFPIIIPPWQPAKASILFCRNRRNLMTIRHMVFIIVWETKRESTAKLALIFFSVYFFYTSHLHVSWSMFSLFLRLEECLVGMTISTSHVSIHING